MFTRQIRYATALAVILLTTGGGVASAGTVRTPLSGWSWGNPSPQGNALNAVEFAGARGYAIGDAGTAMRSDDAGASWAGLASGTTAPLTRLQVVDANTVVVLGGDGCVLRRTGDGGTTFDKIFIVSETSCPDKVQAFWFVNPTTGYLLLRDGSVLRTSDGGQSFSKQTALPGTPASATGGQGQPTDVLFTGADTGIAVVNGVAGDSLAYATTDQGISWKPLTMPGTVSRLYRFDATTIYGIGPGTLLRRADTGATFTRRPFGAGLTLTSIGCATADLCLIRTSNGDLDRTTDGGATATNITAASVRLAGASFASQARAVGVGEGGQTVVSDDAGVNWAPVGGDIGGGFLRLRPGPVVTSAYAPGAKGRIAMTLDGGLTWKVAAVPSSSDIVDTSWTDAATGYALDAKGGLFRTKNGGASWQTLSAGAGGAPGAVLAFPGADAVLLAGPTGLRRATGGGEFVAVTSAAVVKAPLNELQRVGQVVLAWQRGGHSLVMSQDQGASWKTVKRPSRATRIQHAAFTSAATGWIVDWQGRLWLTRNAGRTWTESLAAGTAGAQSIAVGSPSTAVLSVGGFGGDTSYGYVLRTNDAGKTWRPQAISSGRVAEFGVIAPDTNRAYALLGPVGGNWATSQRQFFATTSGGSAGAATTLKIKTTPSVFTRATLKRTRGKVTVTGTLAGAVGGERVVLSTRALSGTSWKTQSLTVGANGGSFSAQVRVKGPTAFVAQWAGDSGRAGAGTGALVVRVR